MSEFQLKRPAQLREMSRGELFDYYVKLSRARGHVEGVEMSFEDFLDILPPDKPNKVLSEQEFLDSFGSATPYVEPKLTKKQKKARRKLLRNRAKVMSIFVAGYMEDDLENGVEDVKYFLEPWLKEKGVKLIWHDDWVGSQEEIEALGGAGE